MAAIADLRRALGERPLTNDTPYGRALLEVVWIEQEIKRQRLPIPAIRALQDEMDDASSATSRSAEGYPDLPADKAATSGDDVRPWNGDEHEGPIRRVSGSDRDANGGYWQREIPASEAEWRSGSAVLND